MNSPSNSASKSSANSAASFAWRDSAHPPADRAPDACSRAAAPSFVTLRFARVAGPLLAEVPADVGERTQPILHPAVDAAGRKGAVGLSLAGLEARQQRARQAPARSRLAQSQTLGDRQSSSAGRRLSAYGVGELQNFIGRTLRLTTGILARDPRQLMPQLLGRIMNCKGVGTTGFLEAVRRHFRLPPSSQNA